MNNGALFSSAREGTSTFSRWCQTEGIKHIKSRVFHPETCGKVERLHGTIIREMKRQGLKYCNSDLSFYRSYYNFSRPHQSLNFLTLGEKFMNHPLRFSSAQKCNPGLLSKQTYFAHNKNFEYEKSISGILRKHTKV